MNKPKREKLLYNSSIEEMLRIKLNERYDEWENYHNATINELVATCKAVYSDVINHQHRGNTKEFPKRKEAVDNLEQTLKNLEEK